MKDHVIVYLNISMRVKHLLLIIYIMTIYYINNRLNKVNKLNKFNTVD